MTEQRLQEIEANWTEGTCCDVCMAPLAEDQIEMVSALIVEVRRLQQQRIDADVRWEEFKAEVVSLRQQRDAALAERDAAKAITSREEDHWITKWREAIAERDETIARLTQDRDDWIRAGQLHLKNQWAAEDAGLKARLALTEARRVLKQCAILMGEATDLMADESLGGAFVPGGWADCRDEIAAVLAQEEAK